MSTGNIKKMFLESKVSKETRVLRRIFGPRRDDVTGEWKKLRTEELQLLE
jgi:hypothetical protein